MFYEIGSKIKIMAKIICVLGIIASLIIPVYNVISVHRSAKETYSTDSTYISEMAKDYFQKEYREQIQAHMQPAITSAVIIAIAGVFVTILFSFCLYGFGELIDSANSSRYKLEQLIDLTKKSNH